MVAGKKIAEVTVSEADLLETDVPVIRPGPEITLRAFRLPSGRKVLLTDADGNFVLSSPAAGLGTLGGTRVRVFARARSAVRAGHPVGIHQALEVLGGEIPQLHGRFLEGQLPVLGVVGDLAARS